MYGFKVSFVKRHKFSFVGFLIQFIESLNVIVLEKRLYWLPFFHVAFYDEHLGLWFNADLMRIEKMTDKQFNEKLTCQSKIFCFETGLSTCYG